MCSQAALRGLAIAGSLRHASFNRATLRAAQQLAPEGAKIESFDIAPGPRMYGGGFFAPWPKRYVHVSKLRMMIWIRFSVTATAAEGAGRGAHDRNPRAVERLIRQAPNGAAEA